jgi:hypothetical protein
MTESATDRTVRLALAAGRANLVVAAARTYITNEDHTIRGCATHPCTLCAALAIYDKAASNDHR